MIRGKIYYILLILLLFSCKKELYNTFYSETIGEKIVFDFEGKTSNESFTLQSDTPIEIVTYPDWLTVTKTGDTGEQTFNLHAMKNVTGSSRTGNVILKWQESKTKRNVIYTNNITFICPIEQLYE